MVSQQIGFVEEMAETCDIESASDEVIRGLFTAAWCASCIGNGTSDRRYQSPFRCKLQRERGRRSALGNGINNMQTHNVQSHDGIDLRL